MTDTTTQDREVHITRAFDAPRSVVFRFFVQPELLARWFAPAGFEVPDATAHVDPRVGGRWALTMQSIETGEQAPVEGVITEFVEPELLVVVLAAQTGMGDISDIELRLEFHDHGDKTRVTLAQGPFPASDMTHATAAGWESSLTKLAGEIAAARS